ncbi:MAG: hypothetical protein ABH865_06920 [Candidatus Omnitrophota bacterium]
MTKNTNRCIGCAEYKNCKDSFTSWIFFIIGIIATVAIRVVTVLAHLDPVYAKISWYVGVIGFFLFFIYKFRLSVIQAKSVQESGLVTKVNKGGSLDKQDYALLGSVLCSLGSKKERINYFFIFGLSAAALVLAVYMDFLK